jgi:hypothetical protein
MRADRAASPEARFAHRGLASGYAARIAVLQDKLGVALPLMAA